MHNGLALGRLRGSMGGTCVKNSRTGGRQFDGAASRVVWKAQDSNIRFSKERRSRCF
jgi:hypothetical protein